jgi:hypothetical protein
LVHLFTQSSVKSIIACKIHSRPLFVAGTAARNRPRPGPKFCVFWGGKMDCGPTNKGTCGPQRHGDLRGGTMRNEWGHWMGSLDEVSGWGDMSIIEQLYYFYNPPFRVFLKSQFEFICHFGKLQRQQETHFLRVFFSGKAPGSVAGLVAILSSNDGIAHLHSLAAARQGRYACRCKCLAGKSIQPSQRQNRWTLTTACPPFINRRYCTLWVSNFPEILIAPTVLGVA